MFRFLPASRPAVASAVLLRPMVLSAALHAAALGLALTDLLPAGEGEEVASDFVLPAFVASERRDPAPAAGGERIAWVALGGAVARSGGAPAVRGPAVPPGEAAAGGPVAEPEPSVPSPLSQPEPPRMADEVDQAVERAPDAVNPPYPADLARQGIEGYADLQFIVDTTGVVEPGSGVVLGFTHRPFADAVLETLPRMRYRPAVVGGEPVRQMVQQRFLFQLRRDPPPDTGRRP